MEAVALVPGGRNEGSVGRREHGTHNFWRVVSQPGCANLIGYDRGHHT